MYEYNERRDIWLFENDLTAYHESDEGQAVINLLDSDDDDILRRSATATPQQLKEAFNAYWDGRNATGLHYNGVIKTLDEVVKK